MLRAARTAVVLVLAVFAGCGGGGSSGSGDGEDPASAVPASAPIYVEASVRPEGDTRQHALDALGKILQTDDPQAKIDELVDKAFADSDEPKISYDKDIKPWLGEKVGFWVASTSGGESSGQSSGQDTHFAAIFASTDKDKAQALVDRGVKEGDNKFSKRSYKGTDYQLNDEGIGVAVLDDYLIVGTDAELKQSLAAADGKSLADSDRYEDSLDDLADDRLASFYFDVKALFDQAAKQDPQTAQQFKQLESALPFDKIGPVTGAFTADGDKLAIDTLTTGGSDLFGMFGAGGSTPLLAELPGDSWGAYGVPKLGETVRKLYSRLAGALGGAALESQLRQQLGIDLQQDVFSWIGDVAFFVRGTDMANVDGGAVIGITDRTKATSAFGKLIGLLRARGGVNAQPVKVAGAEAAFEIRQPGAPKPIVVARGTDRAVIAYGRDAATAALSPKSKLSESDAYGESKDLLGEGMEPAFLLAMPAVVTLAGAASGGDADFAQAKPYLDAFSTIASGGKLDDDEARSRVVAGLK